MTGAYIYANLCWHGRNGVGEKHLQSSGLKGDFFVGKYYVLFDKKYKEELKELMAKGLSEEEADKKSALMDRSP